MVNHPKIIEDLANEYFSILDISISEAVENARYVYRNLSAKDDTGMVFIGNKMKPIVKVIEYIKDPEKTRKVEKYFEIHGKLPEWAKEGEWGLQGFMLPFLAVEPAVVPEKRYFAVAENSGFNDQTGKPAVMLSPIVHLEDLEKKITLVSD